MTVVLTLVGVAAAVMVAVAIFRTLVSLGVTLGCVLLVIAACWYFLPDVVGPYAGQLGDFLLGIWGFVTGILGTGG